MADVLARVCAFCIERWEYGFTASRLAVATGEQRPRSGERTAGTFASFSPVSWRQLRSCVSLSLRGVHWAQMGGQEWPEEASPGSPKPRGTVHNVYSSASRAQNPAKGQGPKGHQVKGLCQGETPAHQSRMPPNPSERSLPPPPGRPT